MEKGGSADDIDDGTTTTTLADGVMKGSDGERAWLHAGRKGRLPWGMFVWTSLRRASDHCEPRPTPFGVDPVPLQTASGSQGERRA